MNSHSVPCPDAMSFPVAALNGCCSLIGHLSLSSFRTRNGIQRLHRHPISLQIRHLHLPSNRCHRAFQNDGPPLFRRHPQPMNLCTFEPSYRSSYPFRRFHPHFLYSPSYRLSSPHHTAHGFPLQMKTPHSLHSAL